MRSLTRGGLAAGAAVTLGLGLSSLAGAAPPPRPPGPPPGPDGGKVVFVQTDNSTGNEVVAYDRASHGTLTLAHLYGTGGTGGQLTGSKVDHLASQGSLAFDPAANLLIAVNAGSNNVSVFSVRHDQLALTQVVSSGGTFPVSVAVSGDLVYVLNAKTGASIQGYTVTDQTLVPLAGSNRSLGLVIPSTTNQFTHTPGQIAFSPGGSELIVTTKANGNDIDVFGVGPSGLPSASPVMNDDGTGTVPFAITFDSQGHLVVAEAGTDAALATFTLNTGGTVTLLDRVFTGQPATCWVAPAGGFFFASNAGGPSESGFNESTSGQLTLLGKTTTDPGTVDASATPDGQFLYVQTGAKGIVDEFRVGPAGTLTELGTATVPGGQGGEGIVAL